MVYLMTNGVQLIHLVGYFISIPPGSNLGGSAIGLGSAMSWLLFAMLVVSTFGVNKLLRPNT